MTRLRQRKRDKIIGMLGEVDKTFADRENHNIDKIKELENQMDLEIFDVQTNFGINNRKKFGKKMHKTYKGLRK